MKMGSRNSILDVDKNNAVERKADEAERGGSCWGEVFKQKKRDGI